MQLKASTASRTCPNPHASLSLSRPPPLTKACLPRNLVLFFFLQISIALVPPELQCSHKLTAKIASFPGTQKAEEASIP
jgi:hypothetical protein